MNKIIKDFQKNAKIIPLRWWTVTFFEFAVCFFIGAFKSDGMSRVLAIVFTAFFVLISLMMTFGVFWITPTSFKKRFCLLSDEEKASIITQYEKSSAVLGNRRFLEEFLIFFTGMKIILLRFSEIRSAELKGFKLLLDTGGKKPVKMPFDPNENPAVIVAALRSRNPNISVILNGKLVEKMENGKENTK